LFIVLSIGSSSYNTETETHNLPIVAAKETKGQSHKAKKTNKAADRLTPQIEKKKKTTASQVCI